MRNHNILFHPRNLDFAGITALKPQSLKSTMILSLPLTWVSRQLHCYWISPQLLTALITLFSLKSCNWPAIWYHCLSFAIDLFIACVIARSIKIGGCSSKMFSFLFHFSFFFHFTFFIESKRKKTVAKQNTRKQSSVTMWNIKQLY